MFGTNPVRKFEDHDDGMKLQVAEIFYTLQGEGPLTGRGAVFVRLSGCNLRCWFCDTKWSDEEDPLLPLGEILHQVETAAAGRSRLIVLTGGEPLRQNIKEFLFLFVRQLGWRVQIETAGTLWQDCLAEYLSTSVTVVVSPKTATINPKIYQRANAFKYVVNAKDGMTANGLPFTSTQRGSKEVPLAAPRPGVDVYLSPCDEYDPRLNQENRRAVAERAMEYGHIAGLQLHKALDLP